jgi:hypothetical protein
MADQPLLPPLTGIQWLDAVLYGGFAFLCLTAPFSASGGDG